MTTTWTCGTPHVHFHFPHLARAQTTPKESNASGVVFRRTDKYTAPDNPLPDTFAGVTNFLHIMDTLISSRPGFRYEGCANGGHFKGLALARRLTFTTTNDAAPNVTMYRQTHWVNTHVHNPLQLKCDTAFWNPAAHSLEFFLRSCFLGSWLVCPPDSINSTHNQVYSEHIALYKTKQRPILRGGNQYHILPFPDEQNYDGMQYHNDDLGKVRCCCSNPQLLYQIT